MHFCERYSVCVLRVTARVTSGSAGPHQSPGSLVPAAPGHSRRVCVMDLLVHSVEAPSPPSSPLRNPLGTPRRPLPLG